MIIWVLLSLLIGAAAGAAFVWIYLNADNKLLRSKLDDSHARVEEYRQALENERAYSHKQIQENNQRWSIQLEAVKQEIMRASAETLSGRQQSLQETNRAQINQLLEPIREKFAELQKSIEDGRTLNEVTKRTIQYTFENTLKLFQQQQSQAVEQILNATLRIGSEAENLTKALKTDTKKQGNWGELVLSTILENCGLRLNHEYYVQREYKDRHNRSAYPDVVVAFPEGRCVVIDSKVSLLSYTESVAADDEAERDRLLREHVKSVRRHIDELVERDYQSIVDDSIGFVLMFMPNESAYIAAIKQEPQLTQEAYRKRVIIISPSNLLMALQLAYNLWQYDRQGKNVEKIIAAATDLYDKVAGFEDAFIEIDTRLGQLRSAYETARNRLYTGRGSVIDRVNSLKTMGITPKKQLKGESQDEN